MRTGSVSYPVMICCAFIVAAVRPSTSLAQVTPLGEAFAVNTYTTGSQEDVSVAMAGAGNFVVVWSSSLASGADDQDGSGSGIFAQAYDETGSPVDGEFQLNAYTTGDQRFPRIHTPRDGSAFTVLYSGYADQDGDRSGVFARTGTETGPTTDDDIQVNTYTTGFQIAGAVVFVEGNEGSGSNLRADAVLTGTPYDNVVVYEGPAAGDADGGIVARRTDSSGPGGPNEAEFLVNTYTTGQQTSPDACAGEDGNFVVVWTSDGQDGDGFGMFGRRFDSNADPIGGEFQVTAYTTGGQAFGSVCCAADGSFFVAWSDLDGRDGQFAEIFARRFDSTATPLGNDFHVNTTTNQSQLTPVVACDSGGNIVVVWQSLGSPLRGRAYDSAGNPVAGEFEIDDTDGAIPQRPAVAMADSGNFVVVWHKRYVDGDDDGVRGRRFRLGPTTTTTTTTMPAGQCGDPVGDGSVVVGDVLPARVITPSDALFVLRAAVNLVACLDCVCDVNGVGGVTPTDALITLQAAVNLPVVLSCPPC